MSTQKPRKRLRKNESRASGSEQPKATSETTTTFDQMWAGIKQKLQGSEEWRARGLANPSTQTRDIREQVMSIFLAVCDPLPSSYDVKGATGADAVAGLAKLVATPGIQKVVSTESGLEMGTKLDPELCGQFLGITNSLFVNDFWSGLHQKRSSSASGSRFPLS
jgi:hypothetical protein